MQLGTSGIPLLPAVAVGVAVVLAGFVLWGVQRVRRSSGAVVPSLPPDDRDEPEPGSWDWTGEAANGAADPPRPPRTLTVADAVAARGADTQPMAAVPVDVAPVASTAPTTSAHPAASRSGDPLPDDEPSRARPVRVGQHRLADSSGGADSPAPDTAIRQWTPRRAGAAPVAGAAAGDIAAGGASAGDAPAAGGTLVPSDEPLAPATALEDPVDARPDDVSADEVCSGIDISPPAPEVDGDDVVRAGRDASPGAAVRPETTPIAGATSPSDLPDRVVPDLDGDADAPDVSADAADAADAGDAADEQGSPDRVPTGPVPPPWSPDRVAAGSAESAGPSASTDRAGSPEPVSLAVQQALAARAVQRARGRGDVPDLAADDVPTELPDARDRLLSVLLTDPATALGATTELDDTRARIDALGDVLRRRRADFATAVHRLHASGLTGEQIGELAGLGCDDVREILEQPSGEGSGGR